MRDAVRRHGGVAPYVVEQRACRNHATPAPQRRLQQAEGFRAQRDRSAERIAPPPAGDIQSKGVAGQQGGSAVEHGCGRGLSRPVAGGADHHPLRGDAGGEVIRAAGEGRLSVGAQAGGEGILRHHSARGVLDRGADRRRLARIGEDADEASEDVVR